MPVVQKKYKSNIFQFPGGGLGSQNPARTIAHSPPGVKETLNYWLREKNQKFGELYVAATMYLSYTEVIQGFQESGLNKGLGDLAANFLIISGRGQQVPEVCSDMDEGLNKVRVLF